MTFKEAFNLGRQMKRLTIAPTDNKPAKCDALTSKLAAAGREAVVAFGRGCNWQQYRIRCSMTGPAWNGRHMSTWVKADGTVIMTAHNEDRESFREWSLVPFTASAHGYQHDRYYSGPGGAFGSASSVLFRNDTSTCFYRTGGLDI